MRYDILNPDGEVVRTIIASREFVEQQHPGAFREVPEVESTVLRVPQVVSRLQAKAAIYLSGQLEAVDALMANEATPMLARLAWANALEFKRQSPTVLAMGAALGLSDDAIDQLFITAAQIEA